MLYANVITVVVYVTILIFEIIMFVTNRQVYYKL